MGYLGQKHPLLRGYLFCLSESFNLIELWLISADIVAAAVLSGNRNFEGRVHPLTRANYLASPPLVVAYALAGTVSDEFRISLVCELSR